MRPTKAVNLSGSSKKAWTHTDWSDRHRHRRHHHRRPHPSNPSTRVSPSATTTTPSKKNPLPKNFSANYPPHPPPSLPSCSLSLTPRSLQARRTKHQSVFSPSTLGPLSHLQVPLKAPTVAPASVHATPSPGTGTADKGPVWE